MIKDNLYDDSYFIGRDLQDKKRLICFDQEKQLIHKYIKSGTICDVGCSTGEFLDYIEWSGEKYGMEVNEKAIIKSKKRGITFEKNIHNQSNFFDVVLFRGTIQHVPHPFYYIEKSYESLKPGGLLIFLSTPNMNSLYYKLFNTLPMLDDLRNFYIPSNKTLTNAVVNFGFEIVEIDYPYIRSPYASPVKDHLNFLKKMLFRTNDKFAFWGNSMNFIARKI